jgi:hypothetical protein
MALRLVYASAVSLTVVESDAYATGGYMTLTATPTTAGGSSVHGVWEQSSKNLTALLGVTTMRFIGRRFLSSYYKKVYDRIAAQPQ